MAYKQEYMELAIELAKKGTGAVNPNPLVGAVIVKGDRIIGQGYHARYGDLHAERAAFASLTEDATGAEMYVTLEPCCHYGKQPPCTLAIVEHGIKKVYVGSDDPNDKVAGKGIAFLREHGVEVETGVMKDACNQSGILPLYNDEAAVCGYEICDVNGRQDRSVHRKEPVDHRGSSETTCAGDTELAEGNHGGLQYGLTG